MLISGDDVIRNIPEQVAKNTEDIDELNHRLPIPDYFYTKSETDALLATKADSSDVYTKGEVDSLLAAKPDILDIYPIGSIYISFVNTDPSSLFGGTWEALNSGNPMFLFTKNSLPVLAGTKHDIVQDEALLWKNANSGIDITGGMLGVYSNGNTAVDSNSIGAAVAVVPSNLYADDSSAISVYMWKRTA